MDRNYPLNCTNNNIIVHNKYTMTLNNGIWYYPAWRHYNSLVCVVCDRCNKSNLPACIGFDNIDLCILCVNDLININGNLHY